MPLQGRYASRIRDADIDIVKIDLWLKNAELKEEIEGLMIAAQDQD